MKPGVIIQMQLLGLSLMAHALENGQFSFDFKQHLFDTLDGREQDALQMS